MSGIQCPYCHERFDTWADYEQHVRCPENTLEDQPPTDEED